MRILKKRALNSSAQTQLNIYSIDNGRDEVKKKKSNISFDAPANRHFRKKAAVEKLNSLGIRRIPKRTRPSRKIVKLRASSNKSTAT